MGTTMSVILQQTKHQRLLKFVKIVGADLIETPGEASADDH